MSNGIARGPDGRVDRDRTICAITRGYPTVSSVAFGGGKKGFPSRNLYAVTFTGAIVELVDVLG